MATGTSQTGCGKSGTDQILTASHLFVKIPYIFGLKGVLMPTPEHITGSVGHLWWHGVACPSSSFGSPLGGRADASLDAIVCVVTARGLGPRWALADGVDPDDRRDLQNVSLNA